MKENKYFRIFIRPTRCANKKKSDLEKRVYIKYYIIYTISVTPPIFFFIVNKIK